MNKCRAPNIPPLLVNNLFILDCREKARYFNDVFHNSVSSLSMIVYYPLLRFSLIRELIKIVSDKLPSYLKNSLDSADPCAGKVIVTPFMNSNINHLRYMSSFFPDATTSWNNVIAHLNDIPSFSILKKHMLSLIRPKKKSIFGIHDHLGLRYLFQLRVGLSSLRYHKNRHNFILLLINVFVIRALEIPITSYFCLLCLLLEEQPWRLM